MKNESPFFTATPSLVLGCILSWIRQQSGLDQQALAQAVGITQASWSRIENGHAIVNFEQIIKSCDALNVEFSYIAQLYSDVCMRLDEIDIAVSPDAVRDNNSEIKKLVLKAISNHALSVSNKVINSDE